MLGGAGSISLVLDRQRQTAVLQWRLNQVWVVGARGTRRLVEAVHLEVAELGQYLASNFVLHQYFARKVLEKTPLWKQHLPRSCLH